MIPRFQKVFALGHRTIADIFKGVVELTEKVDGSQFGFGRVNGNLYCRSRGVELVTEAPDKMFKLGVDYVKSIEKIMPDNMVFYGEYLQKPTHNTLTYDRTPKNHIALFGACNLATQDWSEYSSLTSYAQQLSIDVVPLIYQGEIEKPEEVLGMIKRVSYLGGTEIEGVVVKNYAIDNMIGGNYIPMLCGKYVSEKFKEVHNKNWKKNTGKGKFEEYAESFCTEARWHKALIHLREEGKLLVEPKDIGPLIQSVNLDIIAEEKENIKDYLWKLHSKAILSRAIKGLPQWYKEKLLKGEIEV